MCICQHGVRLIPRAQKGIFVVEYPDGTKITFALPAVNVCGVLWGDRIIEYDGNMTFRDDKNKILCEVRFFAYTSHAALYALARA